MADRRLRADRLIGDVVDLDGAIDALVRMDDDTAGASGIVVAHT